MRWTLTLLGMAGALLVATVALENADTQWEVEVVPALVETANAYAVGDSADDVAIWVDADSPGRSVVIGTNKLDPGGLQVFDLSGAERQFVPSGQLNNVDLREGFPFTDGPGVLVGATNRTDEAVEIFRLDPRSRQLTAVASLPTGLEEIYGFCLHRSEDSGRFYAFVTSKTGPFVQFELLNGESGIEMEPVRSWEFISQTEGCVADDDHDQVFLDEEDLGLWRLPADPEDPTEATMIKRADPNDSPLTPDVEGIAIVREGRGEGYLVASSQGDSTFAVYERAGPHRYLGSFAVGAGATTDAVQETDGIAATSVAVSRRFPAGMLVVHDHDDEGSAGSNFKYVSWADVASALDLPGRRPS